MVTDSFSARCVPTAINSTRITLIPKIYNPRTIKQFRPISLCNTIYKIIPKIVVNRLRPLLTNIISPNQNSFLPQRGKDVNVIVASEILHSMHKQRGHKSWFVLKIDLEKAFDKREWGFIRECLRSFNFHKETIDLVMCCITSVSFFVFVNGKPTTPFLPSRGIRQGDPLSSYIFIICMEYLSKLIPQACDNNFWSPFLVGRGKLLISHLLFADDILLFGETDSETLFALKNTLAMFSAISGQSVNVEKSKLFFSPNTPIHVTTFFEETLSISSTKDLGLYLGFPLSPLKPSKSKVQFIVNKIRGKLASWKTSCLSKAG